jgi:tRNA-intron endonuclease
MSQISVEALNNGRLIIWSIEESRRLYSLGFYGQPLGISKPKRDFEAPLILDPIEGVYLAEKGIIKVHKENGGIILSLKEIKGYAQTSLERFDEKYRVYKDLRNKDWVVTPGIKYGCDFAIYRKGPGLEHAPYILQIKKESEKISALEIVRYGRIATTVHKNFIIAIIDEETITYFEFDWWRA